MAEGIENTQCMVVFITAEYRNKVNGTELRDNCHFEFAYAVQQLGPQRMVPVVMEAGMRNTRDWKGILGANLGNLLYVDMSDVVQGSELFYTRVGEIRDKVLAACGAGTGVGTGAGSGAGAVVLAAPFPPAAPTDRAAVEVAAAAQAAAGLTSVDQVLSFVETNSAASARPVVLALFRKIGDLTEVREDEASRERFATGATEQFWGRVNRGLREHVGSEDVAREGCRAVWYLSRNDVIKTKLGEAGACEAVVSCLTRHKDIAAVAEKGCYAVGNLSLNPANQTKLGEAGACEAVLSCLTRHKDIAAVAEMGCKAVVNLSYNHPANRTKLGEAGACKAVVSCLMRHKDFAAVAHWGCRAVCNLSLNPANQTKLIGLGAKDLAQSIANNASLTNEARSKARDAVSAL